MLIYIHRTCSCYDHCDGCVSYRLFHGDQEEHLLFIVARNWKPPIMPTSRSIRLSDSAVALAAPAEPAAAEAPEGQRRPWAARSACRGPCCTPRHGVLQLVARASAQAPEPAGRRPQAECARSAERALGGRSSDFRPAAGRFPSTIHDFIKDFKLSRPFCGRFSMPGLMVDGVLQPPLELKQLTLKQLFEKMANPPGVSTGAILERSRDSQGRNRLERFTSDRFWLGDAFRNALKGDVAAS